MGLGLGEALVASFAVGVGASGVGGLNFGGALGLLFLLDAGDGVEEELGEVAEGEGVATVEAAAGKLLDGVGEEGVDAVGGVEVAGPGEEFRGEEFGIGLGGEVLLKVVGAEGVVGWSDEHAAATAGAVDMTALRGGD